MSKFFGWFGSVSDVVGAFTAFGTGLMATYALARAYLSWPLESQIAMAVAVGFIAIRAIPPIAAAIRMIAAAIGQKIGLPVRSIPLLSEAETIANLLKTKPIENSEGENKTLAWLFLAIGSDLATGLNQYWSYREFEAGFGITPETATDAISELIIHRVVRRENVAFDKGFNRGTEYTDRYFLTELGAETLRVLRQ